MKYKHLLVLAMIFSAVLAFRLFFAFQVTEFSSSDTYFTLRQVENIHSTGFPAFKDALSYGGRQNIFAPVYYYILSFFSLFLPLYAVGKIIPNIFASSIVIIVYLITYEITKSRRDSLVASLISGFIPIFLSETFNSVSIYSLTVPLIFLALYFFIRKRKYHGFITVFLILCLSDPMVFILVFAFLFYLMVCKLENLNITKQELEIILFSVFFLFWSQFLLYKKAFLAHGINLIWQNIPTKILSQSFLEFDILTAILSIGIIPFVIGIYVIFRFLYNTKNKSYALLTSFALSVLLLTWLKLIRVEVGLMFFGILAAILFGHFFSLISDYVKKTKIVQYTKIVLILFILLFLVTSIWPSVTYVSNQLDQIPSEDSIESLKWAKDNLPNGVMVSTIEEGNLITYFADKKDYMDSNYLMIEDVDKKYDDLSIIYMSHYENDAVAILNKYNIKYVLITAKTNGRYGSEPNYLKDERCFDPSYNHNNIKIYTVLCTLKEEKIEV